MGEEIFKFQVPRKNRIMLRVGWLGLFLGFFNLELAR
jgi:hypothetical protein